MNKLNSKLLIIPIFFLLVLIFIFFLLTYGKKTPQQDKPLPFSPSPTIDKLIQQKTITSFPTLIPLSFTGAAVDPQIPTEELDISTQKYNLRKKMPLKQQNFSIFFDYSLDKFNVILQEPKDITQASFSAWLQNNYASIPIDRFIVQ